MPYLEWVFHRQQVYETLLFCQHPVQFEKEALLLEILGSIQLTL